MKVETNDVRILKFHVGFY